MTREEKLTLSKQYVLDRFNDMSIAEFDRLTNSVGIDTLIDDYIIRYNLIDANDQLEVTRVINELASKFQRLSDEFYNFKCIVCKSYVEIE